MSEPVPTSKRYTKTFNALNFGDVVLKVDYSHGNGGIEVSLPEGNLCSFEGTTDRVLRLSVAGGEAKDVANAMEAIADHLRQNSFSA